MTTRPNILFIQTDQLSAPRLRCYGDEISIAPHIDRLAREGVVFEDSYCNYPLCAPSRFSMMAGQLASKIGAYDNGAEFPSTIPTFAHYLRALGYKTCLSGKMHFIGADQLHGFDQRLTSDIYPGDFVWAADWDEEQHRDTNGPSAVTIAGTCANSVQIDYDEQVAERACDWLARNTGEQEQPFLLTVSFTHPHDPFVCTEEYWSLYENADIGMPRTPPAGDPHSLRMLHQYGITDYPFTDDQIMTARRGYYGSISYVDHKIGQVLTALEASGQAENTVVIVTSDHGEMLGEHGLWMKKVFYEQSLKVPMIAWAPSRFGPRRVAGLVSLVDFLPTLVGFANAGGQSPVRPDRGSGRHRSLARHPGRSHLARPALVGRVDLRRDARPRAPAAPRSSQVRLERDRPAHDVRPGERPGRTDKSRRARRLGGNGSETDRRSGRALGRRRANPPRRADLLLDTRATRGSRGARSERGRVPRGGGNDARRAAGGAGGFRLGAPPRRHRWLPR